MMMIIRTATDEVPLDCVVNGATLSSRPKKRPKKTATTITKRYAITTVCYKWLLSSKMTSTGKGSKGVFVVVAVIILIIVVVPANTQLPYRFPFYF